MVLPLLSVIEAASPLVVVIILVFVALLAYLGYVLYKKFKKDDPNSQVRPSAS